jgi:processing peptidase subunit beta
MDEQLLVGNPSVVTSLGNGMRVASQKMAGNNMATVGVCIKTGSRDDPENCSGVAHFLEHLMFKGTAKRSRSDLELEPELKGAQLAAFTSRETTLYLCTVQKQDVAWAADYLSDILLNSEHSASAVEAERGVILREMEEVYGQMSEYMYDLLHGTAYHDQPMGRTILGPKESVQTITRDDIRAFVMANYTAPRMGMVVAGDVEHAQVEELANKYFGGVSSEPSAPAVQRQKPVYIGSEVRERYDNVPFLNMAIGFESLPESHADSITLQVMHSMLGHWASGNSAGVNSASGLVRNVAERQVGESVTTFNTQYSDTGLFGVYGVTTPEKASDFVWTVEREMVNLCHTTTDADVDRAATALKCNILSHQSTSLGLAEEMCRQLMAYGRVMSTAEWCARIDGVSAPGVRRVANDIINDRDHVCAAHGPTGYLPDYNWMRRRTYMLRY